MSDIDDRIEDLLEDLKQKRDELRVQMNLASREARDEWEELETKMQDFTRRARLDETGEGVDKALRQLGSELSKGYRRMRDAMGKD
ncbi:MAG: hypothetical protein AAGE85_15425 [Pseudomonadota bacterium]